MEESKQLPVAKDTVLAWRHISHGGWGPTRTPKIWLIVNVRVDECGAGGDSGMLGCGEAVDGGGCSTADLLCGGCLVGTARALAGPWPGSCGTGTAGASRLAWLRWLLSMRSESHTCSFRCRSLGHLHVVCAYVCVRVVCCCVVYI